MSIFIDKKTRVLVQGITGNQGSFHTKLMKKFGTNIVAGVTPGKGGQEVEGIPVYNTVLDALEKHKVDWTVIFVPAKFTKDAVMDALDHDLNVVIITERIPVHDTLSFLEKVIDKQRWEDKSHRVTVIGPNCPGLVSPGKCKIGIIPNHIVKQGHVGVVSRSGTLTYEVLYQLTNAGMGQSTVVGIGGDPIIGTDFVDVLKHFEKDKQTQSIVMIGEIGGDSEQRAADYIKKHVTKPVVAYITGKTAPKGKQMGHAGAIVEGDKGTVDSKIKALKNAGVKIADKPSDIVRLLK